MRPRPLTPFVLAVVVTAAAAGCSRPATTTSQERHTQGAEQTSAPPLQQALSNENERPGAAAQVVVPAGTPISARLRSTLTSASSAPGEVVEGELAAPLTEGGRIVADVGAPVEARVEAVTASGHLARPARLAVALTRLEVGGEWFPVVTSSLVRGGRSHTQRNTRFIGGGAAIGAILGQLLGGNHNSTLRGAALGAAAGTGAAAATGKLDVTIPAGETLTFTLSQPLSLPR